MYSGRGVESGCVYVYVCDEQGFYQQTIEAPHTAHNGGRFGTAISVIGDVDQDGFKDVAIGAPFQSSQGVVYIYLGSKNGLLEQPYYKIIGDSKGFGVSVSRGIQFMYPNLDAGVTGNCFLC